MNFRNTESRNEFIIAALKSGKSATEVGQLVGLKRRQVQRLSKFFSANGRILRKQGSGKPKVLTKRTKKPSCVHSKKRPQSYPQSYHKQACSALLYSDYSKISQVDWLFIQKAQKVPYLDYRSHQARLTWALSYIDYDFSTAIFVDKSQFLVEQPYNGWSQVGSPIHVQSRKFPPRVGVWASISCFGKLSICFYEGTLNQLAYQSLLEQHLYPQANELWGKGVWILMQGWNYLSYCKVHSKKQLIAISGSVIAWPSGSPDLNPIENVWGILKDKVAAKNLETKEELQSAILEEWSNIGQ